MVVSVIGGGKRSALRKPPACRKSLTNFITECCIEYTSPCAGFKLTTLVVIDTDCKFIFDQRLPPFLLYFLNLYTDKYILYTYCAGTTVCIMLSQLSKAFHHEVHSVE